MEDPTPVARCLGCEHVCGSKVIDGPDGPKQVQTIRYDMTGFFGQCVERYKELCKEPNMVLKHME